MLDTEEVSPADAATPSYGSMQITEDLPGTRLSLNWHGPRPGGWWRVFGPLGVVLIFIFLGSGPRGPFELAWEQVAGGGPRDIVNDVILGLIVCGGLYFIWVCCGSLGHFAGYWSTLNFEATEQLLTIERRGWGIFFGRQNFSILFPQLQSLSLRVGAVRRGPFPLELTVGYRGRGDGLQQVTVIFPLIGCKGRRQALEFLLAIGRIVSATGYLVGEDSPRHAQWSLVLPYAIPPAPIDPSDYVDDDEDFDEDDDEDLDEERRTADESAGEQNADAEGESGDEDKIVVLPIPVTADIGGEEDELAGATATIVDQTLADKVDVEQLNEKITFAKLVDWKPGERVRIVRERAPIAVFWVAAIFGALVGGGIGGWPAYGILEGLLGQGVLWWPGALVFSGLLGGILLTFISWNNFQEQTVDIVWSDRIITIIDGGTKQEEPFETCRGLLLSGLTKKEYSGSDNNRTVSKTEYGCRLDLLLGDRDVQLLQTDSWESTPTKARNLLQPLGASLAQSLGLRCEWSDSHQTDPATVRRALRFSVGQYLTLAVLLVIAVVGIGRGFAQRKLRLDAGQAVRDLGGEAVWLNGFSMKSKVVYKEFWKVEFENDAEVDAHLAKLHPALINVPELGLELGQCPLTDTGIAQLDGATGLRVLTASNTRITDAGLASIGNCRNLVYLNLYGNDLSDDGLQHLSGLSKLRFLFLGGTRITDAGLMQLGKLKSLEYLQLTRSAVTEAGVQQLKATRPDVEIDFSN